MNAPAPTDPARPHFLRSAALRRAFVIGLAAIVLALAWTDYGDTRAQRNIEAGLKRALAAFAIARTANGVISVIQETTLGASLVVGVTVSPGQILDPLNDLVEEFSTLMLAASVSFGIQRILVAAGSSWPVAAALTALLLLYGLGAWRAHPPATWLRRALMLALLVRFAVPVASIGSEAVYDHFMRADLERSQQQIASAADPRAWGELTTLEQIKAADWRHPIAAFDGLKAKAEAMVDHIVRVITVFLVQTLLLPLLFIWLAQRLLSAALAR